MATELAADDFVVDLIVSAVTVDDHDLVERTVVLLYGNARLSAADAEALLVMLDARFEMGALFGMPAGAAVYGGRWCLGMR